MVNPFPETTVGSYLATRLAQAGLRNFFGVPGDYNLVLLDELLKEPALHMVGCCNELNAGYAADGYARVAGFASVVVTYMVGGLSVINAVAGSYSDDLPVLVISGGPNTNDAPANHLLHHTLGEADLYQASKCFEPVVAKVLNIRHAADAPAMIDEAITTCLLQKRPVYLEIACNLASHPVPAPTLMQLPPLPRKSDAKSLAGAVEAVAHRLNSAVKPVLVGGVKIRAAEATTAFLQVADALGSAVAMMPDAKGLFPESHPGYIGTYWGEVSSSNCAEIVESSDCQFFVGPMFNDYTTTGWTALIMPSKLIHIGPDFVSLAGAVYSNVYLKDFLEALATQVTPKDASLRAYRRLHEALAPVVPLPADEALTIREVRRQIQGILTSDTHLVVETGDSWFNGQKLTLPDGAGYHFQMQYGSIGWATGATLGAAMGAGKGQRVISLIGDGSFQLTAQEVSTMIRYQTNPIIFLFNNRGYTIEVEIHDGPYNNIKNWDYAGLMQVFNAGEGNGLGIRVDNGGQLAEAIDQAKSHAGPVLIECTLDRDDCTKELLEWGSRVAAANSRA